MLATTIMLVGIALSDLAPPAPAAVPPATARRAAVAPAPIRGLVAVRPFRVAEPWTHEWRADRPEVREGWIVVLDADPSLVRPRQTEMPVLMAGSMPLEIVHVAVDAGRLVAILPRIGDAEPESPETAIFHLAAPALPESLSPADAESRRAAAVAAGLAPRRNEEVSRARSAAGPAIAVADRTALDRELAAAIRRFLPGESSRADELDGRVDSEPRSTPSGIR